MLTVPADTAHMLPCVPLFETLFSPADHGHIATKLYIILFFVYV